MTAPTVTSQNRRPVTESSERFLRDIVSNVTIERLDELHLFTALRQGVYETGVAVIAVSPDHGDAREHTRHTVYTARYRLVVKGPDRGRWEFECVAEADAPLITVETVVRGVQRRSGDLDDPVRYDTASLAHVLRIELPEGPVVDEGAVDADAVAVNTVDADAVDVDTVEADAVDVDTVEADAVDVDTVDADAVDVDTVDADAVDVDTVNAEAIDVETVAVETVDADAPPSDSPDPDTRQ